MTNKDEALKMAIEAMEYDICLGQNWHLDNAIKACKEALEQEPLNLNCKSVQKRLATQWGYVEQPAQEPVAEEPFLWDEVCDMETAVKNYVVGYIDLADLKVIKDPTGTEVLLYTIQHENTIPLYTKEQS